MSINDKDYIPYEGADMERYIERVLAVETPKNPTKSWAYKLLKRLFSPTFIDADKLPDKPCLFVANHSIYAVDGPILGLPMLAEHGRFLRALSDKWLWNSVNEGLLLKQGAVIGHPDVCSALMDAGSDLLVFPGGAHEATKPAEQKYTLQWKERSGFVRMAAQHGYTIVPTAVVGPEEFYKHLIEGRDLPNSLLGKLLTRLGVINENSRTDLIGPVPMGLFGTLLPRPQRCFIQFGDPVDLSEYKGSVPSKEQQMVVRMQVEESI
uniref:lysophospholipid acyltransferase family protein n=1 Tax=Spongiibacter sp. TaxID=2024860 RepID=UPI00356560DF